MEIKEALQNIGLNEKEAFVYTALLELGQATAYKIAQKSGLKRPTVYVILDELRLKGLVLKIPHTKKTIFSAKEPKEFFDEVENKFQKAKSILPQLLAMVAKGTKPLVLYFEGLNGMRELMNYNIEKMAGKEMVGFYAQAEDASKELLDIFDKYNERINTLGIKVRGITPQHPTTQKISKNYTQLGYKMTIKFVPYDIYSANISIDMGDNFVRILAFKELEGVLIENKNIADTMRQIFEMAWQSRPEKSVSAGGK